MARFGRTAEVITVTASLLTLAALCALQGCSDATKPAPPQQAALPPAITYDTVLASLTAAIGEARRSMDRQPETALDAVSLYVDRAELTGGYDDYRQAAELLDAASERMVGGSHPCIARARLHFALQRLAAASDALDDCPGTVARKDIAELHADIAFQKGRYRQAELIYRALVNRHGTSGQYVRLALLRSRTGAPGEAAALMETAERRYDGTSATTKAWFKVQRGTLALERGRFDEAVAMYRAASEALPGWWLVDERLAEVKRLSGDSAGASAIYQKAIDRTGSPELLDALAQIRISEGRIDEAAKLGGRARAAHEARLAQFPEAGAEPAIEHFLHVASDPKRALALAESNYASRPNGDAAVALAKALLANAMPKRAIEVLETQLADGWDTAEIHWVMGEALAQLGQRDAAKAAEQAALERNPESAAMYAALAK